MKINYFFIFAFIFFLSCDRKAQTNNSRNDSVEKYLKLASIDTLPFETRKKYNEKAFSFIDLEKNDTVERWYLCEVAFNFNLIRDSVNYYKVSRIHLSKATNANDTLNIARFYRYRGGYHKVFTKKLDSAFFYYLKAEKMYKRTKDEYGLARVYINKCTIQYRFNDNLGAEYSATKAYSIFKKKKNIYDICDGLNELGNIYHDRRDFLKALDCHKEVYKISSKNFLVNRSLSMNYLGTSLNNIGNTYRELKEYDTAILYFNKAFSNKNCLQYDPELKGFLNNNLGYCYLQQKNYSKLPDLFIEAARIFDSCGIKTEGAVSRVFISNYYAKTNDTIKAIHYSEEALKKAKESKSSYYYLYVLSNAGAINKNKAPQYIAEYHRLNDSLLFEERKARNQYFKIQLETDEITFEKEKAIKQKWVQTSAITSLLIIAILLFVIYRQRSQKKEFLLLQSQQKANEEIYQLMLNQQSKEEEARQNEKKRIARELHDNVMNQLASTRFNLFSLTQENNSKLAKEHIEKIKAVEDEIRNLTHELVSENFTNDTSYKELIQQFINQQNQLHSTYFQLIMNSNINWETISSEIKMNLYRIIQEAVHNSNKHSEATKVVIQFTCQNSQLDLIIRDNGAGFDQNVIHQGIGLQNMQQRMKSISGKLFINSTPGKGTLIRCVVEIDSKEHL